MLRRFDLSVRCVEFGRYVESARIRPLLSGNKASNANQDKQTVDAKKPQLFTRNAEAFSLIGR